MRVCTSLQVGLMVLLVVGLARCKQPAEQPAEMPETVETPPAEVAPIAGEVASPVAITEQVLAYRNHLRIMRRTVRNGESQQASLELSEATQLLSEQAGKAAPQVQEYLQYSVSELSGLAERVFTPSSLGQYDMDIALTHVFWAQALYHINKASSLQESGRVLVVAAYLKAVAAYIDEAVGYQSGGLEDESEALVSQLRDVARQLESGTKLDAVATLMEDFRNKIDQYNKQVRVAIETNM